MGVLNKKSTVKNAADTYPDPVIYLAGPMTGIKHFNVEAFMRVAYALRTLGYDVKNPAEHDIEMGFNPYDWDGTETLGETGFDLEEAMAWDLEQVRNADAVVTLPLPSNEWKSVGLQAELDEAAAFGVPVIKIADVGDFATYAYRNCHKVTETSLTTKLAPEIFKALPCRKCFPEVKRAPFGSQQAWSFPQRIAAKVPKLAEGGYIKGTVLTKPEDVTYGTFVNAEEFYEKAKKGTTVEGVTLQANNRWTGDEGEVRTVSSTGGEKGVKLARYDLLPVDALKQIAEHYGKGAEKYDANQWRKGYEWSKSFAALMRHAQQFWGGEDFDEETGSNHMAAVAWHALTLLTFYKDHPEHDDRYKGEEN